MLARKFFNSLSLRVLVLTMGFVLLSEAIILIPSIARSYQVILQQKIDAAYYASLFLNQKEHTLRVDNPTLLQNLDAYAVAYHQHNRHVFIESPNFAPQPFDRVIDLSDTGLIELSKLSLGSLYNTETHIIKISGNPTRDPIILIDITMDEAPLRQALSEYTNHSILLSVSVAFITAILVFAVLQFYMVGPLQRLIAAMISFRLEPENPSKAVVPGRRKDEIGTAQKELAHMQNGLRMALRQKARLAALGTAVTKINHDLRNILSTAQLVSDRLAASEDPNVKKLTPRLLTAIDRANALCASTLDYAKEGLPEIERSKFALAGLVREVAQSLTMDDNSMIDIKIPYTLQVEADREELFRVFTNLIRNAIEAGGKHITVTSERTDDITVIRIADDGPGLKPTARERLFQPFAGSARKGGTGLGLTIARDLMRAHSGDISLLETSEKGTVFQLILPDHDREQIIED